ncbi:MAG TPA: selenocysteine-specific translation elongation factor [Chloroflexota bacterium]|nr:selenocysteine-specific translation elongation factor [Chloroflexota bacterium]
MFVIGTAGHIDHGKSTLVKALTGIDPDRLREEKERGMTIDLGFAWLTLPSGLEVSIVDVPGHERFVHNMLAGVGGIDIALLVIAADEGIMPQTREHLDILDLLQVSTGIVAVTKIDLVEEEWLDLVLAEIEEGLKETSLAKAPLIPVSSTSGQGLELLRDALDSLLADERTRPILGRPRLPIDRVFTIAGFGTVVTGTLVDGVLSVGDELEIVPGGLRARIRGLQSHQRKVDVAQSGARVAVNLSGVSTEDLARGQVLTAPGALTATRLLDVRLRMVRQGSRALRHNAEITFHAGSAESIGKIALLDERELLPGNVGLAQIRLQEPAAVARGDFFVVRLLTPPQTIGGGTVIEPHPRRHRRFQDPVIERLHVLEQGTPDQIVLQQLRSREPAELRELQSRVGMAAEETRAAVEGLIQAGDVVVLHLTEKVLLPTTPLMSQSGWQRISDQAESVLAQFHQAHPLRSGVPREELRGRLGLDARMFNRIQELLVTSGLIVESGRLVRLSSHMVQLSDEQLIASRALIQELRSAGASPPLRENLEAAFELSSEMIDALVERGDLVAVSPELVYDRETYSAVTESIVAAIREHGPISVAQVRDVLGTSRRYALALMSHLDERRVTRRVGDERVLM